MSRYITSADIRLATTAYEAPITSASTFLPQDWLGAVRTAWERRAAHERPVATIVIRTSKA